MSNPKPVYRLRVKDSDGSYRDLGSVWRSRFDGDDGTQLRVTRPVRFGNFTEKYAMSIDEVCEFIKRASEKGSQVFIDLVPVKDRRQPSTSQETYEDF